MKKKKETGRKKEAFIPMKCNTFSIAEQNCHFLKDFSELYMDKHKTEKTKLGSKGSLIRG